jgi:DNA polymerase-3 subunit alpha
MGRADLVRKAMSKKKHSVMEEERKNFIHGLLDKDGNIMVPGAVRNGVSEKAANQLFDMMMDFASYAFNKAHAAAYAVVAYQTAYLKKYYPLEFMAAMLTSVMGSNEKVAFYINACKKMGIDVLPPDVNESHVNFTVIDNKIRFGLAAVKNVGRGAIYSIISGRRDKGAFTGFVDFCQKINLSDVNKRAIESLIKAGAFDSLGFKRAQLLNVYEKTMESIVNDRKRNIEGQVSFFSMGAEKTVTSKDDFPDIKEFDKKYILAMEKEMLGLYISGHPLDEYEDEIETQTNTKISEIIIHGDEESGENHYSVEDGQKVIVGGIVSSINIKATRKNDIMAFVNIEDMFGSIEVVVFPKVYQKCSRFINEDSVVLIKGRVSVREDEQPKILAEDIEPLRKGPVEMGKLFLRVEGAALNNKIKELKPLFEKYKGNCPVYLVLSETREKLTAPKDLWVTIDQKLLEELKNILGSENVKVG